ncbi:MAG: hypothetical protein CM15mP120_05920 [Pseudomonadota bacterium]|nr:MAG: hypothetical protein CM15mP120_05920 [Pseudomonadota bacterium]
MGIYRSLVAELLAAGNLQSQQQALLFNAVQRKAESDIRELVGAGAAADMMVALPTLMGQPSVLDEARKVLAAGGTIFCVSWMNWLGSSILSVPTRGRTELMWPNSQVMAITTVRCSRFIILSMVKP